VSLERNITIWKKGNNTNKTKNQSRFKGRKDEGNTIKKKFKIKNKIKARLKILKIWASRFPRPWKLSK
jgi:hypothetical protein